MAGELGQQTVEFSALVSRAAEDSFLALKELVEKEKTRSSSASAAGDTQSDTERKINLLKYIVKTQQRMLRLNVLAKWCQQVSLSLCVPLDLVFLWLPRKRRKKQRECKIWCFGLLTGFGVLVC
jgi:hypothetical protein